MDGWLSLTNILILLLLVVCGFGLRYNNIYVIYWPLIAILLIGMIKMFGLFQVGNIKEEFHKGTIEFLSHIVQIIAFLCAGLYFMYQVVGNLDITDLSLKVQTQRITADSLHDHLSISVNLDKGPIASVHLHDIKAFLYPETEDTPTIVQNFSAIKRIKIREPEGDDGRYTATDIINTEEPYRMAANESTQFSEMMEVSHHVNYRVVIVVITRRRKLLHWVVSQFKASAVSLAADH